MLTLIFFIQRNWVFATNSNFLIPISFQPYGINLDHLDLTEVIVWYIKGLRHQVAKNRGKQLEFVAKTHFLCCFFLCSFSLNVMEGIVKLLLVEMRFTRKYVNNLFKLILFDANKTLNIGQIYEKKQYFA